MSDREPVGMVFTADGIFLESVSGDRWPMTKEEFNASYLRLWVEFENVRLPHVAELIESFSQFAAVCDYLYPKWRELSAAPKFHEWVLRPYAVCTDIWEFDVSRMEVGFSGLQNGGRITVSPIGTVNVGNEPIYCKRFRVLLMDALNAFWPGGSLFKSTLKLEAKTLNQIIGWVAEDERRKAFFGEFSEHAAIDWLAAELAASEVPRTKGHVLMVYGACSESRNWVYGDFRSVRSTDGPPGYNRYSLDGPVAELANLTVHLGLGYAVLHPPHRYEAPMRCRLIDFVDALLEELPREPHAEEPAEESEEIGVEI